MTEEHSADLSLIARQQPQLLSDMATLREDVPVLTAIVLRQDATLTALLNEDRATHSQHARLPNRVRLLEEPAS
jgi:hypothetical protein